MSVVLESVWQQLNQCTYNMYFYVCLPSNGELRILSKRDSFLLPPYAVLYLRRVLTVLKRLGGEVSSLSSEAMGL